MQEYVKDVFNLPIFPRLSISTSFSTKLHNSLILVLPFSYIHLEAS